ncbi:MAG TPA: NAD(P)H-binding protein, partial [Dissulfurispiraceae bacterium]|nr:NAD(P)H-binding protein [Dissulfurispiraceae bacterium]
MRVLLAGGAGYLGRRLAERLIDDPAVHLRILVADARKLSGPIRARAEIVEGDPLDTDVLGQAMESIDVAYYPLRYFGIGRGFEMLSRTFTARFIEAAAKSGVRRIVYMGVTADGDTTSNPLRSMAGAGEMLSAHRGKMEIVQLRMGAVVGSGGVFFGVPNSLVRNFPFILAPRWMEARLHTISVSDALECLAAAKDMEVGGSAVMDIGGEEVSFKEMITATAEEMGLKRPLVGLPVTV